MNFDRIIDKLSEEQQRNAIMVAEAAIKAGVDPKLAVAVAYQESRLRSNPPRGKSGEIGMMQVMPGTGKEMGFDERSLADPAKNIEAGIRYLQRGLTENNNDPKLAAAFYNGGPGAIQALQKGDSPDPRVLDYVRSLDGLGVFSGQAEPAAASEDSEDMVPVPVPAQEPKEPGSDVSGASPGERFLGAGIGAGVGAIATGAQGISQSRTDAAVKRAGMEEAARERARIAAQRAAAAPGAAPAAVPAAPQSVVRVPEAVPGGRTQLGVPGTYPAATGPGSGVFNYGRNLYGLTEIEAARALDMSKQEGGAGDLAKKRREAMMDIKRRFPGDTFVENPRFGGIMTPDQGVGSGPRQSFVSQPPTPGAPGQPPQSGGLRQLPPRQPISTTPPAPSGLERATGYFKQMMRPVSSAASGLASAAGSVAKYALPPVAGVSAGLDLAELGHEYDKPADQRDLVKMGLRGASALGGGLSMIPATAPLGVPLALGATAAQMYREDPEMLSRLRRRIFSSEVAEPSPSP